MVKGSLTDTSILALELDFNTLKRIKSASCLRSLDLVVSLSVLTISMDLDSFVNWSGLSGPMRAIGAAT